MTRVAQLSQQTLTLQNVLNTQERIQDSEIQVATGKKSLKYAGIARDTTRLVSLETSQKQTDQFIANNTIIEGRLQHMDSSVSSIFDSVTELRRVLVQALSDSSSGQVQLAEIAQNLLDNVSGQLNSKINGRFVFAGSRTTTRPVTVPVPNPTNFGTPDSTYYQGDSLKLTARLDESTTITYGITGDRIEFQNAIGALKAAIEGANTNNRTLKNTALSLAETAIQGLAGLRTEMGVDMDSISRANSRNNDFLLFTEGMISDIENVDIAFTVARLATEQTILQASYMTLARVTSLSLVDFL